MNIYDIISNDNSAKNQFFNLEKIFLFENSFFCNVNISFQFNENEFFCTVSANGENEFISTESANLKTHKTPQRAKSCALGKASYKLLNHFTGYTPPYGTLTGVHPVQMAVFYLKQGFSRSETKEILLNEYFVKSDKADILLHCADEEINVKSCLKKNTAFLYVSIPFCPTRCKYCSFISSAAPKHLELLNDYTTTLLTEISLLFDVLSENEIELPGIYIGGGTPSTLNAEQLFMLCDKLIKYPFLTQNFEFTVECGRPDTITDEKLSALKECKVNRISINPQTKNNDVLKEIGRNHTYEDFLKAYELARAYSFDCINTDLIAGLPKDTADGFLESLKAMLDLSPENITVHSFCKKKSADFTISDIHSNEIRLLPEIIKKANDLCINKGYNPYYLYRQKNTAANLENIGYAKDGKLCLYNIAMMQDLCNVFSAGAGAISKIIPKNSLKTLRISHDKYPFEYLKNTEKLKERIIKLNNILRNDDV